jgi:hypothetical protein
MRVTRWLHAAVSTFALACSGTSTEAPSSIADTDAAPADAAPIDAGAPESGLVDDPVAGCPIKSTGYKTARVITSTPRGSNAEWKTPAGAEKEDGSYAEATLTTDESALLMLSDFGFEVPTNTRTFGIEVELVRYAPQRGVVDGQINLHIEGKPSRYKFIGGPWPLPVGTHHYGQKVDTWGVDLYPADVNAASFAVSIWVKKGSDGTGTPIAAIDALRVQIHYCEGL